MIRHRRQPQIGATLIDVAIGSMMLSLLLIPSMKWIGHSQSLNQRLEDRDAILFEAEELIETLKVKLSDPTSFADAYNRSIDEIIKVSSNGTKTYLARYQVDPDKTLPKTPLLTIQVTVWFDADRDAVLDSNETSESLQTQWAAP
ncbi:hypothetical protein [Rubripirellula lacrimiformis]|nr:hypothetical protein [Rubripirellula lacrimiformis]